MSNEFSISDLADRRRSRRAFPLVLAVVLGVGGSAALPLTGRAQTAATAPPSPPLVSCEMLSEPAAIDARAFAQMRFDAGWLAYGESFFASYTMPGESRNPFDRQAGPLMGGREGVVEAMASRCLVEASADGLAFRFRFVAPFYRFHEAPAGWSPPLRDGLMQVVSLQREGAGWRELPSGEAPTILTVEQSPRRTAVEQRPKPARWREPIPPCGKGTKWTGRDCVSTRRAGRS